MAPSVARALLAAERPVPAVGWLSLLTAEAGQDHARQRAVAGLVPLFALAGVGGSDAVPRIDGQRSRRGGTPPAPISRWPSACSRCSKAPARRSEPAHGQPCWPGRYQRQQAAPATVLWRGLEQAAAERRVGDTVLFALQMLNGRPEAAHPEVLVACLRALSRVGLDRDARAIAVATALISDL